MELTLPSERYRDSFLAGQRELIDAGEATPDDVIAVESFSSTLAKYDADRRGDVIAPRVPQLELWYVDGDVFIGRLAIRHHLNDRLTRFGGHIGYGVRPSRRRQGHASQMLALALPKAHALGITRVLVTCDEDNVGSRRTIEKNRGELENIIEYEGTRRMRFWIPTSPDFRPLV